jgi:hypothetical protein
VANGGPEKVSNPVTLHEAMRLVLLDHGGRLHAKDLASEIADRNLYLRADGAPAGAGQLRALARRYPKLFSCRRGEISLVARA